MFHLSPIPHQNLYLQKTKIIEIKFKKLNDLLTKDNRKIVNNGLCTKKKACIAGTQRLLKESIKIEVLVYALKEIKLLPYHSLVSRSSGHLPLSH